MRFYCTCPSPRNGGEEIQPHLRLNHHGRILGSVSRSLHLRQEVSVFEITDAEQGTRGKHRNALGGDWNAQFAEGLAFLP